MSDPRTHDEPVFREFFHEFTEPGWFSYNLGDTDPERYRILHLGHWKSVDAFRDASVVRLPWYERSHSSPLNTIFDEARGLLPFHFRGGALLTAWQQTQGWSSEVVLVPSYRLAIMFVNDPIWLPPAGHRGPPPWLDVRPLLVTKACRPPPRPFWARLLDPDVIDGSGSGPR